MACGSMCSRPPTRSARFAGIPVVVELVNAVNHSGAGRALPQKVLGVARDAPLPRYYARTARARLQRLGTTGRPASVDGGRSAAATPETTGRVAPVCHLLRQSQRARAR